MESMKKGKRLWWSGSAVAEFFVAQKCFLSMDLKPTFLEEGLVTEIYKIAEKYQH